MLASVLDTLLPWRKSASPAKIAPQYFCELCGGRKLVASAPVCATCREVHETTIDGLIVDQVKSAVDRRYANRL